MSELVRVNLGAGDLKRIHWINVDIDPSVKPDLVADALDLSAHFKPGTVDEITAFHCFEHLTPTQAEEAIDHWKSLLKPGGILAVVTPDFKVLCEHYLAGDLTIERLEDEFVYSYCQPSNHASIWDQERLFGLFERHGFVDLKPIDRFNDERLAYKDSLQTGVSGNKA